MHQNQLPLLQQSPFRYIHLLKEWDEKGGVVEYVVESHAFFVEDEQLQFAGLMEHLAQSCAALIGQLEIDKGHEVHIMPLCSINNMVVKSRPKIGDVLRTNIFIKDFDFGIYLMDVNVYNKGELIASAEVKVGA